MKPGISCIRTIIVFFVLIAVNDANPAQRKLRQKLFENYDVEIRPVKRQSDTVQLNLQFVLFQILRLYERDQTLEVSVWIRQSWYDSTLTWNPEEYDNITQMNMKSDNVWNPDVVVFNSVSDDSGEFGGHLNRLQSNVIVFHTGRVLWLNNAILKTHCKIVVRSFPFDTQECKFSFSSWTYELPYLNISTTGDIAMGSYQRNAEWHVVSTTAVRSEVKYGCCENDFVIVEFFARLSRRSLFYVLNLVFPIAVITFLTRLSFLLPAESGERISLAVTLLLAGTVFMLFVAEVTPATSEGVPIVTLYFILSMVDVVVLMITVCYVNHLHHKTEGDKMGEWTRRFILDKLSIWVGIQQKDCANSEGYDKVSHIPSPTDDPVFMFDIHKYNLHNVSKETLEVTKAIQNMAQSMVCRLDRLVTKVKHDKDDEKNKREWRIVAMTVDRCLLIFFIFTFVLILIVVFRHSPGYVH